MASAVAARITRKYSTVPCPLSSPMRLITRLQKRVI
jgi:hypothetical protein